MTERKKHITVACATRDLLLLALSKLSVQSHFTCLNLSFSFQLSVFSFNLLFQIHNRDSGAAELHVFVMKVLDKRHSAQVLAY